MDIMNKKTQYIQIKGEGPDKVAAISTALNNIQKQVLKESSDVTLRIEPKEVTVLSAEEIQFTERFMFFFFKRVCNKYRVLLEVKIELLEIQTDKISFTVIEEPLLEGKIPFLAKK